MGALINPDIFEYYQDNKPLTEARWRRIQDYIRDKGIDYYVTFQGYGPDPAETPGFKTVKVLKSPPDYSGPYGEIRIYRVGE